MAGGHATTSRAAAGAKWDGPLGWRAAVVLQRPAEERGSGSGSSAGARRGARAGPVAYGAEHLAGRVLRLVWEGSVRVGGQGSGGAVAVDGARGRAEGHVGGGRAVTCQQTARAVDCAGESRSNGLVDGQRTSIAVMRGSG